MLFGREGLTSRFTVFKYGPYEFVRALLYTLCRRKGVRRIFNKIALLLIKIYIYIYIYIDGSLRASVDFFQINISPREAQLQ
jgi:hypothetical protein